MKQHRGALRTDPHTDIVEVGGHRMRTFATLSITGVTVLVVVKLLAMIMFPLLALIVGLFAMTVKFALIAAVAFFFFTMFRRRWEKHEAEIA